MKLCSVRPSIFSTLFLSVLIFGFSAVVAFGQNSAQPDDARKLSLELLRGKKVPMKLYELASSDEDNWEVVEYRFSKGFNRDHTTEIIILKNSDQAVEIFLSTYRTEDLAKELNFLRKPSNASVTDFEYQGAEGVKAYFEGTFRNLGFRFENTIVVIFTKDEELAVTFAGHMVKALIDK